MLTALVTKLNTSETLLYGLSMTSSTMHPKHIYVCTFFSFNLRQFQWEEISWPLVTSSSLSMVRGSRGVHV